MSDIQTPAKDGKPVTKTAFIRNFPLATPADEIVAKAKDAGLDLTKKFVWTIQSELRGAKKAKKKIKPSKAAPTMPSRKASNKPSAMKAARTAPVAQAPHAAAPKAVRVSDAERRMKALVIELGTVHADELFKSVRAELNALLS